MARSAARAPNAIKSLARWKSNQPIWPTRGVINRSGGSPASRARVMRSCMMLKASTITLEMPGRPPPPKNSRFIVRSAENNLPKPRFGGAGSIRTGGASVAGPWEKMVVLCVNTSLERLAATTISAPSARGRHRHWIHQSAVHQPAVAHQHRRKNPGQRVRGPHRLDHAAVGQPDLMAGADLGRHGRKLERQIFDQGRADGALQLRRELVAADQA